MYPVICNFFLSQSKHLKKAIYIIKLINYFAKAITDFFSCLLNTGYMINELEDEDLILTGISVDERQEDSIYMELRPPLDLSDVNAELWDLNEEDLNLDFGSEDLRLPEHDNAEREESFPQLIKWIMIFLCIWASYCCISDNAMDILINFISAIFKSLASMFPALTSLAFLFPKSFNLLKTKLGLNQDQFTKFVVCTKCDSLYKFEDCFTERFGRTVIKQCPFISQENHRQLFRRTACGELLLKEVILKNGRKRFYPFKVYCYNSIIEKLKQLIARPGFMINCESWRNRNVPNGFLADIFDGKVWKDFMYVEGKPFFAAPHNYGLMLNVDWFQPFKHSIYSVGALYLAFINLPRELRFKPENIILVGIIPGPHEPKLTINSYLKPLVAELNTLWEGVQIKVDHSVITFRAALLCVGCDVPAARKVCGFTGHASCHGCSKCKKFFLGNVSERMDFSGFETCPDRTNEEHREQAQEILDQTTQTDKYAKEQQYGTRFTELMMLPYFDCVRFHIIDPMHNLFTGSAKHIMRNIWLEASEPVIDKKSLDSIQEKINKVSVPSSVGRLPKKIANSYGGFTADQWKTWTIIYSLYALWDILPKQDLEVWREFVLACSYICTPIITETKARLGHVHLLNFCTKFENIYGKNKVTPNMHLHMHILQCILDFGPVYSFWLFSFERFNGILGEYSTNQRSVEIQIMRKFLSEQYVKALPLPTAFADYFSHIFKRMSSSGSGTLQEMTSNSSSCSVIMESLLSFGPVRKGNFWEITNCKEFITCLSPITKQSIAYHSLRYLKESYKTFLENVNEATVTIHCEFVSAVNVAGEIYGSSTSRNQRSGYIMAAWCGQNGRIDTSGTNIRPGVIEHFIRQNVEVDGHWKSYILAEVKWFHPHNSRHAIGAPVEVWCRDHYEMEGPADFIPLQRIHSKFVPAFEVLENETVLVVCPMPRKLQC